jgi:hypothetical protein
MIERWADQARDRLISLRRASGSWGYGKTTNPAIEPTALAGLALRKSEPRAAALASDWLLSRQSRMGSVPAITGRPEASWATALASLLWAALDASRFHRDAAISWLLASAGATMPKTSDGILGQDPTLLGWPWISETASWVEPTALALLALCAEGRSTHRRTVEGLSLIRDRAIPNGGWNMGNPVVFGTPLRPLPAPTGLALLALARAGNRDETTAGPALAYLQTALQSTSAPASLGWGLLGLRAWSAYPAQANEWLAESYASSAKRSSSACSIALLLLASADDGLSALGITPVQRLAAS